MVDGILGSVVTLESPRPLLVALGKPSPTEVSTPALAVDDRSNRGRDAEASIVYR